MTILTAWARRWLLLSFMTCGTGLAANPATDSVPKLRVPEGFIIERVANPPQIRFPMFGALDEHGRLFITESSGGDLYEELKQQTRGCRISVLEDRDGDGRYEQVKTFAEQLVPSMGLAWRDGKLFVADPPDLITLEDTNGDGAADQRKVILTGFGHTDNGSLHGLLFGPDGWLYMTMGWPDSYRLPRGDGTWLSGKTGALLRCRADGSSPEALAQGFDQLIELIFLPGGEMLGSQTWYQNPSGGLRDSLTHLVPGGVYPQRWQDERPRLFATGPEALPPVLLMPATAHSGIEVYRGNLFPPEWRGHIFSAEFNTRKVVCHKLTREGSSFRAEPVDFVTTDDPDFRPADVLEDADGTLLVLDTGSWYVQHCPTGRMRQSAAPGAIYRVRPTGTKPAADPRGRLLDWQHVSNEELAQRLPDSRPVVRDRAVECLVRRGPDAIPALAAAARSSLGSEDSRAAAVWALGRIGGSAGFAGLRELLRSSTTPAVVSAAARLLGGTQDRTFARDLEPLLAHADASVRLAVAEALANCGRPASTAALLDAAATEPDRMLEHAIIYALHRTSRPDALRSALNHSSALVQKAALLVLAQEPHRVLHPPDVLTRLSSTNEPLRRAAQFCLQLRPDWAQHAVEFVEQQLRAKSLSAGDESALLDLVRSLQGAPAMQQTLARALIDPDEIIEAERKLSLLELVNRSGAAGTSGALHEALLAVLDHANPAVRLKAVQILATRSSEGAASARLENMAANLAEDPAVRLEALAGIVRRRPDLDEPAATLLGARLASGNSPLAQVRAAEVLALARPSAGLLSQLITAAAAEPAISPNHVLAAAQRSVVPAELFASLLRYLAESVERGWAITEPQLGPLLMRVPGSAEGESAALLRAVRNQTEQQQELLRQYAPLLAGGDAARGRQIFFGKVSCGSCHRVGHEGVEVGPDLTKLGSIRSGQDILESVLLPSATFAQGYDTYSAELKDGEFVTGVLSRESPEAILLRTTSGAEVRVPRAEMESLTKSRLSMMPEGLMQVLTREEAADLLAFLQDLK